MTTIEEAIKKLKEQQNEFNEHYIDYAGINEAYNMAIKALEQQPCDDCISRQAVLDINEHHCGQMPRSLNHEIWKEIKALPPVTSKEKTGHWVGDRCSNCGNERAWYGNNPLFCPDCGAKMEVSE